MCLTPLLGTAESPLRHLGPSDGIAPSHSATVTPSFFLRGRRQGGRCSGRPSFRAWPRLSSQARFAWRRCCAYPFSSCRNGGPGRIRPPGDAKAAFDTEDAGLPLGGCHSSLYLQSRCPVPSMTSGPPGWSPPCRQDPLAVRRTVTWPGTFRQTSCSCVPCEGRRDQASKEADFPFPERPRPQVER